MARAFKFLLAALHTHIFKRRRKKREKRKRKPLLQAGHEGLSRFFEKILPDAGGVEIFYKNPKGLTLKSRNGQPNFAFF
jgi:hypothetical protein